MVYVKLPITKVAVECLLLHKGFELCIACFDNVEVHHLIQHFVIHNSVDSDMKSHRNSYKCP